MNQAKNQVIHCSRCMWRFGTSQTKDKDAPDSIVQDHEDPEECLKILVDVVPKVEQDIAGRVQVFRQLQANLGAVQRLVALRRTVLTL